MYNIDGRKLCMDCAVKYFGLQDDSTKEATSSLTIKQILNVIAGLQMSSCVRDLRCTSVAIGSTCWHSDGLGTSTNWKPLGWLQQPMRQRRSASSLMTGKERVARRLKLGK